jgi:hypothetical protein
MVMAKFPIIFLAIAMVAYSGLIQAQTTDTVTDKSSVAPETTTTVPPIVQQIWKWKLAQIENIRNEIKKMKEQKIEAIKGSITGSQNIFSQASANINEHYANIYSIIKVDKFINNTVRSLTSQYFLGKLFY